MNNRVLVVGIPASETTPDQRKSYAQLTLSSIRMSIAMGLGPKTEGNYDDVIANLPIDKRAPSMIVIDEMAEGMTKEGGFAVTITQSRSLGIAMVISNQDWPGLVKAGEEEAEQMFENTMTKILLKHKDGETFDKLEKSASKMWTSKSDGYTEGTVNKYRINHSTKFEQVSRINARDVQAQREGYGHVMTEDEVVKAKLFHHGLSSDSVKNFRINRKLQILAPTDEQVRIIRREQEVNRLLEYNLKNDIHPDAPSQFDWRGVMPVVGSSTWINALLENIASTSSDHDKKREQLKQMEQSIQSDAPKSVDNVRDRIIERERKQKEQEKISSVERALKEADADWIYNYDNAGAHAGITPSSLFNKLSQLNKSMGMSDSGSEEAAFEQVENISGKYQYTTTQINPLPTDLDKCLEALDELDD